MKKKFSALQKDIEDQREEIRTMFAHKKELYQVSLPSSRVFKVARNSRVAGVCFRLHTVWCTIGQCPLQASVLFASLMVGTCTVIAEIPAQNPKVVVD